jgi:nitroreductase
MEFLELINKRKSIRKFSDKPVEKEKLENLLTAINKAPSAGNLQSYEIYVVKNKELQKKMYEYAKKQSFLMEATYVLVFCTNPERAGKYAERGRSLYSLLDAAIACTYAHLAATDLGLGSVWVGAFNEEYISELLSLPKELRPVAMLPIGYAGEDPEPKPRRELNDIVKFIS